jgi:hypothetical protein
MLFPLLVTVHALAASVRTGGHLVLALHARLRLIVSRQDSLFTFTRP